MAGSSRQFSNMSMKKFLLTIIAAFISLQMFAQINATVGYLNSTYRYSEGTTSANVNGEGVYAGVNTDIYSTNFGDFSFSPGIYFDFVDYELGDSFNVLEYYLRAPLHFKYTYTVDNRLDVFGTIGPSAVLSLGSKSSMSYGNLSYNETEKGGDFDLLFGFEGGVNLSSTVRFVLGYDFGLINQGDANYNIKRNILHLGIGYLF